MTDRKSSRTISFFLLALLYLASLPAVSAVAGGRPVDLAIEKLENEICRAFDLYDTGVLTDASPYQAKISKKFTTTFSKSTFETDLTRAFDLYEILLQEKGSVVIAQTTPRPAPVIAAASAVRSTPPPAVRKVKVEADDEISALMQAEQETRAADTGSQNNNFDTGGYDVYADYSGSHLTRLQQADKVAEYDMQNILAQRQAADAERLAKMQRAQEVQGQAMEWQAQLDKQASESARKAAEWEATHSFGAYATSFLGTIAQTAIGSFTGGLLTPIATVAANKVVGNWFGIDPGAVDKIQQAK